MINKQQGIFFFIAISVSLMELLAFVSCRHDPEFINEPDTICFEEQILPVLQNSCGISGCHDGGSGAEGFSAADYQSVMRIVTAGDVHASKLYRVITDIWGEYMMPPDRPLTLEQRTVIHIWIAQGAPNTTCSQLPPDTSNNGNNGGTVIPKDSLCFVQDILPIFNSSCATKGCHDAATHEEGYNLTSYATITSKAGSIVPFNPNESKLYRVVTGSNNEDRMPPPPLAALPSTQTEQLRKWIEQGALNSDCPQTSCDTTGTIEFSTQVWPVIQVNCAGCHNASISSGNVNLDGYAQVKTYADLQRNGTPVLIGSIRHLNGFFPMPQNGKLQDCDIRQIELWIEQGKLNN
jgi:hypothetical protein